VLGLNSEVKDKRTLTDNIAGSSCSCSARFISSSCKEVVGCFFCNCLLREYIYSDSNLV
jgi:hypothetical protein